MVAGQRNNPLHGIKLEQIVRELEAAFGWEELALRIPVNCFKFDPSVKSSLAFLRKTEWARKKVEDLYVAEVLVKHDHAATAANPWRSPVTGSVSESASEIETD